ncbi:hypothetical protein [Aquamicrobium sp.]|uniref:hypothetical protein n=1 Tax=Aquamicrobium sp. TaxID=1872579 RepID=UPI002583840D|nr:hypothetical protein [Aquamicrobium sp.]MCK9553933.1 hypothetical protein [Aquamicrobium sp.]
MIPGSLDPGDTIDFKSLFRGFRTQIRRYFWLWMAWQTVKGITTTTIVWAPLVYMYFNG